MTFVKSLVTSRKFVVTLLALIAIVISAANPNFNLDVEAAASMLLLVISYVIAVAVDPGPGGWAGLFKSRKFWSATIGLVVIFLNAAGIQLPFGLETDHLVYIAVALSTFITSAALQFIMQPAPKLK